MTDASPNREQAEYWSSDSGAKWVQEEYLLDATLGPVLDRLLAEADLRPGQSVLDIGCGTGASTLAAASAVAASGTATGVDISPVMLARARDRAQEADQGNARFVEADAQVHAFPDGAFDAVISRFGVMFFADPVAAFANIARAMKPGAPLAFMAWGGLPRNPWFAVPRSAAIDRLGAPPPMNPRDPGPMAFAEAEYVSGILNGAGLRDVAVTEVTLDLTPPGTLAEVAHFATYLGPAARIIRLLEGTEADTAEIAKSVEHGLRPFANDAGVRVPAVLNLVTARA